MEAVAVVRSLWRVANPWDNLKALFDGSVVVWKNFTLAGQLAHRDLAARYKGQIIGAAWMVAHPLMLMLIFLFIFGVVFRQRLGDTVDMPRDYSTYILAGLIPWLACVPALSATCMSVVGSSALVKQFHFDTAALPIREVISTSYFWGVGLAFIAGYTLIVERALPWTYLLLPAVLLVTFIMLCGIGWLFAAVTVFFRDLKDIVTVLTTMFLYVLPIVYLPEWTPVIFQGVIKANPLSYMMWVYQDVLYYGRIAHPDAWAVFPVFAVLCFMFGHRVFKSFRPYFGNVL